MSGPSGMSTGEDTQDLPVAGEPWWNAAGGDPRAESGARYDGAGHELAGPPASGELPRAAGPPPSAGLTRAGRPARAVDPGALAPVRAFAGAAVAVAGVALGIGTLLWASESPDAQGPVVGDQAARAAQADEADAAAGAPDGVAPATPSPPAQQPPVQQPSVRQPPVEQPAAAAPPSPPPAPPPSAPPAPPAQTRPASVVVPVTVLNNSRRTGLAARAAARFADGGWPVRETGNYTGRLRETTLYYAPGQEAAAQSFARTFRGITRVLPRFDRLPGQGLTVVLTRDFPA